MLPRTEIRRRLGIELREGAEVTPQERLIVSPLLDPKVQIQQGGIDLRLGGVFLKGQLDRVTHHDPAVPPSGKHADYQIRHVLLRQYLVLQPGEMILGSTLEYIVLPEDVVGFITLRSSWGRLGLSLSTPAKINAGGRLSVTLGIFNQGPMPIKLYPGARFCHLHLFGLGEFDPMPSRYDFAIGPEPSKLYKDDEIFFLSEHSKKKIVGITGCINSGKSRVARKFAERLHFPIESLSAVVRSAMRRAGDYGTAPRPDEEIQEFKANMRQQSGYDVLARRVIQKVPWSTVEGLVIDGIVHPAEVAFLRHFSNFVLVVTDAGEEWRWRRYSAETRSVHRELSREQFHDLDRRRREGLDIDGTPIPHRDQLQKCIDEADDRIETERYWGRGLDGEIERVLNRSLLR